MGRASTNSSNNRPPLEIRALEHQLQAISSNYLQSPICPSSLG